MFQLHERVIQRLNKGKHSDKFGTWGDWSAWSPCSRSCGTGVAIQSRECNLVESAYVCNNIEFEFYRNILLISIT